MWWLSLPKLPLHLDSIFCHDESEVCNPLESNTGTHKVGVFCYTVGSSNSKFCSKICAIRLPASVNARLVETYDIQKMLSPIIDDLKTYEGCQIETDGSRFDVFGKLLFYIGNTLG